MGLLLCECRMLYENKLLCEFVHNKIEADFKKNHTQLKTRIAVPKIHDTVNDVLQMLFKD